MFFYTFKYISSNFLYMNFQVSSKSLCSDYSSKLQVFKASLRFHNNNKKVTAFAFLR